MLVNMDMFGDSVGGALTLIDTQIANSNQTYTYQKGDYVFFFASNTAYQHVPSTSGVSKIAETTSSYNDVGGGVYQITDDSGQFTTGNIGGIAFFIMRIE